MNMKGKTDKSIIIYGESKTKRPKKSFHRDNEKRKGALLLGDSRAL
jgi:hypothetical protein